MSIHRDTTRCLCHIVDGSAWSGEREGLPSMLATSFAEAAGVSGRQNGGWCCQAVQGFLRLHIKR